MNKSSFTHFFTRVFLVSFLTVLSIKLNGQIKYLDGFVVLNNGDTLKGKVLNQPNSVMAKTCELKVDDVKKVFKPLEIQAYGITESNRLFKSKIVDDESLSDTLFLEYLVNGAISLYNVSLDKEWYFIEKEGEIIPLIEERKRTIEKNGVTYIQTVDPYKASLSIAFEGLLPPENIYNLVYGQKSLTKITTKYHKAVCDWDCTLYRKSTKSSVSIIPVFSPSISKFNLSVGTGKTQEPNLLYGVQAKFTSIKSNFFSLVTGVELSSTTTYSATFSSKIHRRDLDLDAVSLSQKMLSIPFLLRWEVIEYEKLSFYILAGAKNYFLLKSNYNTTHYTEDAKYEKFLMGLHAAAGISYSLNDKVALQLNPFFERISPIKNTGEFFDYIRFTNVGTSLGMAIGIN